MTEEQKIAIKNNLNGLLEETFQLDSFCDYLHQGEAKASNIMSAISDAIDSFDPESNVEIYADIDDTTINNIFNTINKLDDDMVITCNSGFTTVGDLKETLSTELPNYMNQTIGSLSDITMNLTNAAGAISSTISLPDLVDELKMSIGSSTMERAAIMSSKFDNISDKLSSYETIAGSVIDTNCSLFKNTSSYYKQLLVSKLPGQDIIAKVFKDSGVAEMADEDPVVPNDFDFTQFTGANPLGTFSLNCLSNVASAAGKVVAATATVIWNGIKSVGSWIFKKASKFTKEVFTNPYDITDNGDNDASYSFEGFQYQKTGVTQDASILLMEDYPLNLNEVNALLPSLRSTMNSKLNEWYSIRTIGGETACRMTSVTISDADYYQNHGGSQYDFRTYIPISVTFDYIMKPYSLRPIADSSNKLWDMNEYLSLVNSRTGKMYCDTNDTENDLANSFLNGICVMFSILDSYAGLERGVSPVIGENFFTPYTGNEVTNAEAAKLACGYRTTGNDTYFDTCPRSIFGHSTYDTIAVYFPKYLICHYLSKIRSNGSEMIEYAPFLHGTQAMTHGRFGIKTDSTNQNIATALAAVLLVIVAVVVIVVVGITVIKKIQKKNFWKRQEFLGRSDNAMWNGKTLTKAERRKYIRYSRKQNACTLLTKGMAVSDVADDIAGSNPITELYNNIVGTSIPDQEVNLSTIRSLIV